MLDVPEIFTHLDPDMDSYLSVVAVRKFVSGMANAKVVHVSASWDGSGMKDYIAVDLEAGGQGIKGKRDPDGTVHSAFADIIDRFANDEDKRVLGDLAFYIDKQDSEGSVVDHLIPNALSEVRRVLAMTSLGQVVRALEQKYPKKKDCKNIEIVYGFVSEIFDGFLTMAKSGVTDYDGDRSSGAIFAGIVSYYGNNSEDQETLAPIIRYLEIQRNYGSIVKHLLPETSEETQRAFAAASLGAVLRAIEYKFGTGSKQAFDRMRDIFEGFHILYGSAEREAIALADDVVRFNRYGKQDPHGRIALVLKEVPKRVYHILWSRGVEVLIYTYGNNLGIRRRGKGFRLMDGSRFRADHPAIMKVIAASSDDPEGWFVHSKKFGVYHGGPKAPATMPSKVEPLALVQAIANLMK